MRLRTAALTLLESQVVDNEKRAKEIAAVLVSLLEKNKAGKGVDAGKQRKGGIGIRGDFGADEEISRKLSNLKDWDGDSIKFKIIPSPTPQSSQYQTYIITPSKNVIADTAFLKKRASGLLNAAKKKVGKDGIIWKAEEGVYLVNSTAGKTKAGGKKHFKTKDLVPEKFGLAGAEIPTGQFLSKLIPAIESRLANKKPQAKALIHMVEEAGRQKGNTVKLDPEILKAIENDIGTVAKDFGEVAGALWFAKREDAEVITFPSASNEKLVDYAIIDDGIIKRVSAKSGAGGTPSIKVIPDVLDDLKGTDFERALSGAEKKAAEVLRNLAMPGVVRANITANQILNTKPWQKIQKITGGAASEQEFEEWVTRFPPEEVIKKLTPFWIEADKNQSKKTNLDKRIKTFRKILNGKGNKKNGIITVVLGFHASRELNDLPEFNSLLNKALQTVTVIQVFLDMKASTMEFTVKPFATGVFEFKHNGQTSSPSNRGFSFQMKKGSAKGVANLPESFLEFCQNE